MLSEDSRKGFQKNNLTKFNFIVTFGVFFNLASSVLSLKNIMEYLPRYFAKLKINNISESMESKKWKYKPFTAKQVIFNVFKKMY